MLVAIADKELRHWAHVRYVIALHHGCYKQMLLDWASLSCPKASTFGHVEMNFLSQDNGAVGDEERKQAGWSISII